MPSNRGEAAHRGCGSRSRDIPGSVGPIPGTSPLAWCDRYAGGGHDTASERTRAEYRRLLATFALRYFDERLRLRDLDRRTLGAFVTWLTRHSGPDGLLCDRSIRNALTPLRGCLRAARGEGLVDSDLCERLVLPRRRGGKPHRSSSGDS